MSLVYKLMGFTEELWKEVDARRPLEGRAAWIEKQLWKHVFGRRRERPTRKTYRWADETTKNWRDVADHPAKLKKHTNGKKRRKARPRP